MVELDSQDRLLLSAFQRDFPLVSDPYAVIGKQLGLDEREVRQRLTRLMEAGVISRVGAVIRPNRVGVSTLAAMAVPPERLEEVAALVSARPEVNHNYEREHRLNLWFVVTAKDRAQLLAILEQIALDTGILPLDLPMIEDFHIDLGFDLAWT